MVAWGQGGKGRMACEGAQGGLWRAENILYSDCSSGFTGVYLSKISKLYTLNGCRLFCVNYLLIKLIFKVFLKKSICPKIKFNIHKCIQLDKK